MPTPAMPTEPITILLVEDDPVEVMLVREALADYKLHNNFLALGNGRDALAYLCRSGAYEHAELPGLILLDLNLPGVDGRDLLAYIGEDPLLSTIPIVVLTSSLAERDILRARQLRVSDYLVKPVDFHRLVDVVRHIEQLGLSIVRVATAT
jgi:CheY-like chemotaxis protein